jgi:hypothetical protein
MPDSTTDVFDEIAESVGLGPGSAFGEISPQPDAAPEGADTESKTLEGDQGAPAQVEPAEGEPYWKSQHDKLVNQFNEFKQEVESVNPLMRAVNENPSLAVKVFEVIEQGLSGEKTEVASGDAQGAEQSQAVFQSKLKEPEKPEKPTDYDESEAYSEPGSESWNHRLKVEEWRDAMSEHAVALAKERADWLEEKAMEVRAMSEKDAQKAQLSTVLNTQFGMDATTADKFMNWVENPQYTLAQAVQAFGITQGLNLAPKGTPPQTAPTGLTTPPATTKSVSRPLNPAHFPVPAPAAAGGTHTPDQRSVEDQVFDKMLQDQRSLDPFNAKP